ncbi:VOC family protein [Pelagovum pacificum]|uniref:Bleomycin resistance protein n=2 Tax=Pelagovum pacificum TaxID=2588711 RepID=A0A5C5GIM1_9RHOB|nr:VOC family protein [Pelagovum pacificum]
MPEFGVFDLARSLDFYISTLGFSVLYEREGFACVDLNGARLMLEEIGPTSWMVAPAEPPLGRGMHLQIMVQDVDTLAARVPSHFIGVEDVWYRAGPLFLGQRQFVVTDPDGYLLRFAQSLGSSTQPPDGTRIAA